MTLRTTALLAFGFLWCGAPAALGQDEVACNLMRNGTFRPGLDSVAPMCWILGRPFTSPDHARVDFTDKGMRCRPAPGAEGLAFYQFNWGDMHPGYRLTCRVKTEGAPGASVSVEPVDLVSVCRRSGSGFVCKETGKWLDVDVTNDAGDHYGFAVFIRMPKGVTEFSIESLSVLPAYPEDADAEIRFANAVPLAGIVLSRQASFLEKLAAAELKLGLFQLTGRAPPIHFPPPTPGAEPAPGRLYVGRAAREANAVSQETMDGLGRHGYAVVSANGCGAAAGASDAGVISAVYCLLERLGARHFAPRVFSFRKTNLLTIPDLDIAPSPVFDFTTAYDNATVGNAPWRYGFVHGDAVVAEPRQAAPASGVGWIHPALFLTPPYRYASSNPEYYAMDGAGKRRSLKDVSHPAYLHICLGSPRVQDVVAERVCGLISRQPEREYFSIAQADGVQWCRCLDCARLDPDPAPCMDRFMQFANRVAARVGRQYPDKKLLIHAYGRTMEELPLRTKPAPNLAVMYAHWGSSWPVWSNSFCERNRKGMRLMADWLRLMPERVLTFMYPVNVYETAEKTRYYAYHGVKGFHHCGYRGEFPEVMIYVSGRMVWDPDVNVEGLIDEVMPHIFGAAAAPFMREYFNLLHDRIRLVTAFPERFAGCWGLNQPQLTKIDAEFAAKAYRLLAQAEAGIDRDSAHYHRFIRAKSRLMFPDLNSRNRATGLTGEELEAYAERLAEFLRLARLLRRPYARYREPIGDWVWQTAAVDIDRTAYGWLKDKRVDAFISNPVEGIRREARMQTALPDGWSLPAEAFRGGKHTKPGTYVKDGVAAFVQRARSPSSQMSARASSDVGSY